jgi:tetratricopeptide (TPR) repeat protein
MLLEKANRVFFFAFLLSLGSLLYAQNLEDAYKMELEGDPTGSLAVYQKWLDNNVDDPLFLEILFHAFSLISDIDTSVSFLDRYRERVQGKQSKVIIVYRTAQLLELAGRSKSALEIYRTIITGLGKDNPEFWVKYYALRFNSGDFKMVDEIIRYMEKARIPDSFKLDLVLIIGKALFYSGQKERGLTYLSSSGNQKLFGNYPLYHYCLWDLYTKAGMITESEKTRRVLKSGFPESLEYAMVQGTISVIESPVVFLEMP